MLNSCYAEQGGLDVGLQKTGESSHDYVQIIGICLVHFIEDITFPVSFSILSMLN